jgi:hypothetical protein
VVSEADGIAASTIVTVTASDADDPGTADNGLLTYSIIGMHILGPAITDGVGAGAVEMGSVRPSAVLPSVRPPVRPCIRPDVVNAISQQ